MFAPAAPLPGLDARFAAILDGVRQAIAVRAARERAFVPLALLLWGWLNRTARRFSVVAARTAAGTLPPLRPSRAQTARQPCPASPCPASPRLPRGFAWLLRHAPETGVFGSQLRHLLSDPEMAALLAAAPRAARHLRPVCRMLGVRPDPALPAPCRTMPPSAPVAAPVVARHLILDVLPLEFGPNQIAR